MEVVLGNDHAGYPLREIVIKVARELGYHVVDFGVTSEEHAYTTPIAEKVSKYIVKNSAKGILICGSGVGMSIAANKVPGIRAVVCSDIYTSESSRSHNNTNVLAIGARVIGEGLAEKIIRVWLLTEYEEGRREVSYQLISDLENRYFKNKKLK